MASGPLHVDSIQSLGKSQCTESCQGLHIFAISRASHEFQLSGSDIKFHEFLFIS